jgi:hypothetical protein
MELFRQETGGRNCRPAPLLRQTCAAGTPGRKGGRGLHHYGQRGEP